MNRRIAGLLLGFSVLALIGACEPAAETTDPAATPVEPVDPAPGEVPTDPAPATPLDESPAAPGESP